MTAQQKTVERLTADLDALTKAKKDHEAELLKKFAALLNSKKLKIRDQQRLLASAKVDPKAASKVQQARAAQSRVPTGSRSGKRKAVHDSDTDDTGESDNAQDETGDPLIPEKSNVDVTDDDPEDAGFAPARAVSQVSRPSQRELTGEDDPIVSTQREAALQKASQKVAEQPPPRRELPFAKKADAQPRSSQTKPKSQTPVSSTSKSQPVNPVGEDDATTDEDDDEL